MSRRSGLNWEGLTWTMLLTACIGLGSGCKPGTDKAPGDATTSPTAAADDKAAKSPAEPEVYQVKGVVQEVKPEEKKVVIKHEEIPNYMAAMTMPFDVKDGAELTGIAPGDEVTFRMFVTEDDGWIQEIKKTGQTNELERPTVRLVRDVDPLEVGMKMPDYTFTNSLGKTVKFSDYPGHALAFTFIFTRCPFPLFCPRMNENMNKAYQALASDPNAPTNWHLFSISFDPTWDTPARLREYSKRYSPDDKKWDFVTGALIDIDAITEQFGLAIAYQNGNFDHKLRTVIVDKNGVIRQILIGNEWKPEELVEEIKKGAAGAPLQESN